MTEDKIYNQHFRTLIKDVLPNEDIDHLINLFILDSATMMGNSFTKETLELVTQMVKDEYGLLPVYYVAMAFKKGALGKLGVGRLVGATIHRWLSEITNEYYRDFDKEKQKSEDYNPDDCADLHTYPLGKAIIKKIDWFKNGILNMNDWDKVPLKDLAERIKAGLECYPEVFGLVSLKPIKKII
jgi:hypothetical protein